MKTRKSLLLNVLSVAALILLLLFAVVPIIMMIIMSLRDTLSIYGNFWGLPIPPKWGNYSLAVLDLIAPAGRTLLVAAISIIGIMVFSCLAAFAFARIRFLGKELLFSFVIFMMTIPGVLLLTPNFILADWLHLKNSLYGLAVFYIGSGQLFAIFLLRTFFGSLPEELFEAARIEGASEISCVWRIAVPLAIPILITIAIMNVLSIYNDLIWPMLMISSPSIETIAMALAHYAPNLSGADAMGQISRPDLGIITSGYMFGSIPLLLIFLFGMRYFVDGLTSGAIKA